MEKITVSHSEEQARLQLESVTEMVNALKLAENKYREIGTDVYAQAQDAITEDALSVEVRSDWHQVGEESKGGGEYTILLCTGGPAVRIIGMLSQYNEPETAHIQHQDWGTLWTELRLTSKEELAVLTYAGCFYYGEV